MKWAQGNDYITWGTHFWRKCYGKIIPTVEFNNMMISLHRVCSAFETGFALLTSWLEFGEAQKSGDLPPPTGNWLLYPVLCYI